MQRNSTFKLRITLDRHNARPRLNYYFLPGPSHFSLPSTFNKAVKKYTWMGIIGQVAFSVHIDIQKMYVRDKKVDETVEALKNMKKIAEVEKAEMSSSSNI